MTLSVLLILLNGCDLETFDDSTLDPDPDFTAAPTEIEVGHSVSFHDKSTNAPKKWLWDFGDGETSTEKYPSHVYDNPGVYTVKLEVTNDVSTKSIIKEDYITVNPKTVNFTASQTDIVAGQPIQFTDQSKNSPTGWLWKFGDGTTSDAQNPYHIYNVPGTYDVTLTVYNNENSFTESKPDYIRVSSLIIAPTAEFTANPTTITAGQSVQFMGASIGSPEQWFWNFGDGTTSTVQNPLHTYEQAGIYNVSLTVANSSGSDSQTKTNLITVNAPIPVPVAQFVASKTSVTEGSSVKFTDESTNSPSSWLWDFGDGTTSTLQNPSHTYGLVGKYTVTLTVTNSYGSDTQTKSNYITVNEKKEKYTYEINKAFSLTGCWPKVAGDCDMDTDGGDYVPIIVELTISHTSTAINLSVYFYCSEDGGDNTTFQGVNNVVLYSVPSGGTITDVNSTGTGWRWSTGSYGEQHNWIPFSTANTFCNYLSVRIDSSGDDCNIVGVKGEINFKVTYEI